MEKELEYYGITRQVNEGPKPVNNFKYLEDISNEELDLTETRAFHRSDFPLRNAAKKESKIRYIDSVIKWSKDVDKRIFTYGTVDYLKQCSEIIRLGINKHNNLLINFWPNLKEKADMLAFNLRLNNSAVRKQYKKLRELADILVESKEMMGYE